MTDMTPFQAVISCAAMMIALVIFVAALSKYNRESSLIIERAIRETE